MLLEITNKQLTHLLTYVVQLYDEQYEKLKCHSLLPIVTRTLKVCSSIHFAGRFHFALITNQVL